MALLNLEFQCPVDGEAHLFAFCRLAPWNEKVESKMEREPRIVMRGITTYVFACQKCLAIREVPAPENIVDVAA